jgi:enamine deaminase RidA (YjgF/YER057c/UK114 family)
MNRRIVNPRSDPWPPASFRSEAVRAGPFVFTSGLAGSTARSDDLLEHAVRVQTDEALHRLAATLEAGGSSLEMVVRLGTFHRNLDDALWHMGPRTRFLGQAAPPSTAFQCGLVPGTVEIELEAIALATDADIAREVITTDRAPTPRVPYAQAIKAGPLVFTAGFMATDLRTGVAPAARVPAGLPHFYSPIKRQTEWVVETLGHVLEAAGTSLDRALRAFVILTDMRDFFAFDEVWRGLFGSDGPARTVIQGPIFNPNCLIEVDLIALAGDSHVSRETVVADSVPEHTTAEPQAVRAGEWVFVSGQLPTDYATGLAPEAQIDPAFPRYASVIEKQAQFVFSNLAAILEASGTDLEHVVRLGAYHTSIASDFLGAMETSREFFTVAPPASTTIEVEALAVPQARFMIDAIAVLPDGANVARG